MACYFWLRNFIFHLSGLDRSSFDNKAVSFEEHCKSEHNMWHYLYFIVLIKVKDPTEFTGPESYVYTMVKVSWGRNIFWIYWGWYSFVSVSPLYFFSFWKPIIHDSLIEANIEFFSFFSFCNFITSSLLVPNRPPFFNSPLFLSNLILRTQNILAPWQFFIVIGTFVIIGIHHLSLLAFSKRFESTRVGHVIYFIKVNFVIVKQLKIDWNFLHFGEAWSKSMPVPVKITCGEDVHALLSS